MNITHTTRMIPAAALAVVLATSAQAYELFPLSSHDDWTVGVEVWDDGGMSCTTWTTRNRQTLEISITDKGAMQVFIMFDNPDGNGQVLPVDLVIEGVTRWQIDKFEFTQHGAGTEFVSQITGLEFMMDMQRGTAVRMTQPGGEKSYGVWSLRGSRDAIDAMLNCYTRIAGAAA